MYQDFTAKPIRASAVLTNAYVPGFILGTQPASSSDIDTREMYLQNQLLLYISFTLGGLTDGRIKIEFSNDNVTFYQETNTSQPAAGVVTDSIFEHKYTASGNFRVAIPIKDRYIKISAMGTGVVAGSLMQIDAIIGVV